jgi:outer membrane protein OmpA-like peptidoglycan-associated protein
MRKLSIWHWLLATWLLLGVFLWQQFLADCWLLSSDNEDKSLAIGAWQIRDSDNFYCSSNEHFKFLYCSDTYLQPFPIHLNEALIKTAHYIKDNPNKILFINGFYRADEINGLAESNLGIARAAAVKSLMLRLGAPSENIKLAAVLLSEHQQWFSNDTLQKGIDFSFTTTSEHSDIIIKQ